MGGLDPIISHHLTWNYIGGYWKKVIVFYWCSGIGDLLIVNVLLMFFVVTLIPDGYLYCFCLGMYHVFNVTTGKTLFIL